MTAREWLLGAVPTHFAERALVNTFELLSDSLEQMRADAEGGDSEAKAMLDPLMSLALAVGQLGNGLAAGDRQKTAASLDALRSARRALAPGSGP